MMAVKTRAALAGLSIAVASAAEAQVIGTFRWQTEPYCNVLTLTVTQRSEGVFTLAGFDDQCDADQRAPVSGTAVPNPDGTMALGLAIVHAPEAFPVHVTVPVSLASLDGTWRDSAGASGQFRFTPGAGTAGTPRPTTFPPPPVNVALPTTADGSFDFSNPRGFVSSAPGGASLRWLAAKRALRAGAVDGTQWDDANVGTGSVAFGLRTVASGEGAVATGTETVASGASSFAMGERTAASGATSMAMGTGTSAVGYAAVAMGRSTSARGRYSLAGGDGAMAFGESSFAMGFEARAFGIASIALGSRTRANGAGSVALGTNASAGTGSFAFGDVSGHAPISASVNQFKVRASGGFGFYTNQGQTMGVELAANSSQFLHLSDVNAKEHFRDLDADTLLDKIARLPVREWSYKAQGLGIRHVGPTAQDFHAAFGLGEDPLRIGTLDADGINLAAAKALEARTQTLMRENTALRQTFTELAARLERLERLERLARKRLAPGRRP